jgi:hypothetical protein
MEIKMYTWKQPYSVKRLLRMISEWTFHSDYDGLEDVTGEPSLARASRRIDTVLEARRDERPATYNPIRDEEQALFYVEDVALIAARLQELEHLERQIGYAVGPPCRISRFNKKTGKFEDLGLADDYGD